MPTRHRYFFFAAVILALSVFALRLPLRPAARLYQLTQHFTRLYTPAITTYPAMAYEKELDLALLAVQRAAILTKAVYASHTKGTLTKTDSSPVTIGDFGAQALIIASIKAAFPDDEVVGEEDAADLRANPDLKQLVWDLVQQARLSDPAAEATAGGPIASPDAMLAALDSGASNGGNTGRIWALDPIDGTKGFLRGGQYAVCLALLVDGRPTVGVIACPNLPIDDAAPLPTGNATDSPDNGVLFAAVHGHGATSRPLTTGALAPAKPIHMSPLPDVSRATFCESVEAGHSSHSDQAAIASALSITAPSVRMDSQAKYCSIARGAGDLYLRLPTSKTYEEKIWDHAAGVVLVQEAGGVVTDAWGKGLDFGLGRTLKANKGVVAAPAAVHGRVVEVVREVLGKKA